MKSPRYGVAEWFGQSFQQLSSEEVGTLAVAAEPPRGVAEHKGGPPAMSVSERQALP